MSARSERRMRRRQMAVMGFMLTRDEGAWALEISDGSGLRSDETYVALAELHDAGQIEAVTHPMTGDRVRYFIADRLSRPPWPAPSHPQEQ